MSSTIFLLWLPLLSLEAEFDCYIAHQATLVKKYRGQFVVIKGDQVLGAYPDEITAVKDTQKTHELGTFLVQFCAEGRDNYSQTHHSRVAFA